MTYATRRICDADSHLMELPDFLTAHAERSLHDALPRLVDVSRAIDGIEMDAYRDRGGHSPEHVNELLALGDRLLQGPKWHAALGSFNGAERSRALDLLGFERQVVFSSFCAVPLFEEPDPALRRAAIAAHNRAVAAFCRSDPRLLGVALLDLEDPRLALREIEASLSLGLGAFWLPARAPGGRSPGHPAHDAVWERLADAGTPFLLHVGSNPLSIGDAWMNDGRPDRRSARGGAEVIGSKDLMVIYQAAETFLSVLVLDGVLERFPTLRGGAIELGAGWVPAMLRRLDQAQSIWSRSEPHLARMERRPSEQARDQLRFTPYPFEDVGQLLRESDPALYLFSSDYPHAEGGRNPLGRFEESLAEAHEAAKCLFYAENFDTLYGTH